MFGNNYLGLSRKKVNRKYVISKNIPRKARSQKPTCQSASCRKTILRSCDQFSEENRLEIFKKFWSMSWEQKKSYVISLIDTVSIRRKTTENISRRNFSYVYRLVKASGIKVQVCKKMFLNTLGLSEKMVTGWYNNTDGHMLQPNPNAVKEKKNKLETLEHRHLLCKNRRIIFYSI